MIDIERGIVVLFSDESSEITLSGRYSRTIQVYFVSIIACEFLALIIMIVSHDWQEWYLFFPLIILLVPMFMLYSKQITVVVESERLFIREKKIDVTQRIKTVKRKADNTVTVRFNILYQLNVTGSPEQIDNIIEQLRRYVVPS